MYSETSCLLNHNPTVPAAVVSAAQQIESFDVKPVYLKLPCTYGSKVTVFIVTTR